MNNQNLYSVIVDESLDINEKLKRAKILLDETSPTSIDPDNILTVANTYRATYAKSIQDEYDSANEKRELLDEKGKRVTKLESREKRLNQLLKDAGIISNETKQGGVEMVDANGVRAIVYPDGTIEEVK
jgi:hypothetical protein